MKLLIIGGDNLENIVCKLHKKGFNKIEHISGRKKSDKKITGLLKVKRADLVIVLVDYINHGVVKNTKESLKSTNTKAIFSKRSWIEIENQLDDFLSIKNM